jgi:tellurite resistance protein TerC
MHLILPDNWNAETFLFIVFGIVITVFLILDLGVFSKKDHKVSTKTALWQSIFWVAISMVFAVLVYLFIDKEMAGTFLLAYLTEKALSVDNIFVWLILLQYFNINEKYYHRILFYGVIGAIVFRGIFITAGFLLIEKFHWILYVFGVILIYSGVKLLKSNGEKYDPEGSWIYKVLTKRFRFVPNHHSGAFWIKENGKWHITTIFLTLIMVEATDIVFAMDSIPAVFGISQDKFVVYTSNVFAILGLRAMFFLISGIIGKFQYLQYGLSLVLIFIGLKMFVEIWDIGVPIAVSLILVVGIILVSILASLLIPKKSKK